MCIFALNNIDMKLRNITIFVVILLLLDQALKIWIKTHLCIDEAIEIFPWFQLRFIENNGAAFGMQLNTSGAIDWGKLLLSLFRIVMIGGLGYYIHYLNNAARRTPRGVIVGLVLIMAGAIGNLIDSMFYGMLLDTQDAGFLMGKVVDMIHLPLFKWENCPDFLSFLVGGDGYFFGAVFNVADAYISVAVFYLLIFQFKFFNQD